MSISKLPYIYYQIAFCHFPLLFFVLFVSPYKIRLMCTILFNIIAFILFVVQAIKYFIELNNGQGLFSSVSVQLKIYFLWSFITTNTFFSIFFGSVLYCLLQLLPNWIRNGEQHTCLKVNWFTQNMIIVWRGVMVIHMHGWNYNFIFSKML